MTNKERNFKNTRDTLIMISSMIVAFEKMSSIPEGWTYNKQAIKKKMKSLEKDLEKYLNDHAEEFYNIKEDTFIALQKGVERVLEKEIDEFIDEGK